MAGDSFAGNVQVMLGMLYRGMLKLKIFKGCFILKICVYNPVWMCCNIYRFKIQVWVADESGNASFVIFDPEASNLVGISACELSEKQIRVN